MRAPVLQPSHDAWALSLPLVDKSKEQFRFPWAQKVDNIITLTFKGSENNQIKLEFCEICRPLTARWPVLFDYCIINIPVLVVFTA